MRRLQRIYIRGILSPGTDFIYMVKVLMTNAALMSFISRTINTVVDMILPPVVSVFAVYPRGVAYCPVPTVALESVVKYGSSVSGRG